MIITYNCDLWNKIMEYRILKDWAIIKDSELYTFEIDYEGNVSSYFSKIKNSKILLDKINISKILQELNEFKNTKKEKDVLECKEDFMSFEEFKESIKLIITPIINCIKEEKETLHKRNAHDVDKIKYDIRDSHTDNHLYNNINDLIEKLENVGLYE